MTTTKPTDAAVEALEFLTWLRETGATITVSPAGDFHIGLDTCVDVTSWDEADTVSKAILRLRDEIRALLTPPKTVH